MKLRIIYNLDIINTFKGKGPEWNRYLGDCTAVQSSLHGKPLTSPVWFLAQATNIIARSVGQTVFVNNPLLSLIILLAMFLCDLRIGLCCCLGSTMATITELIVRIHPWNMVENGVAAFNGGLIGSVIPALHPLLIPDSRNPDTEIIVCVVIGSVASVFITSALSNLLNTFSLPFMTLPFNIVAICTFITILPDTTTTTQPPTHNITEPSISWPGVGHGILVSMGQVYAVHCLQSSCIINLAVLLYSPLLFCMCTLGATIGSILPLNFLSPQDYPQVYAGLWGYSPLLSMAAVSCVIYPLSGTSMLAGTINAITTVFIQKALIVVMGKTGLPVFTLPFTLATLLILLAWQEKMKKKEGKENKKKSSLEEIQKKKIDLMASFAETSSVTCKDFNNCQTVLPVSKIGPAPTL